MNKKPLISVIMPVYNADKYLQESIESILNQTYENFEFLIINDGSTDKSLEVINSYKNKDRRIKVINNNENKGLIYSLNKGLENSKGKYIARMDADDISVESRFEEQVNFLENNKDISIVSCDMILFDEESEWGITRVKNKPLKEDFSNGTPFTHAASMVLKKAFDDVNGYEQNKRLIRVEDYYLWAKMYNKGFKGENILKPLYKMRDNQYAAERRNFRARINEMYARYIIFKMLNLNISNYFKILRPVIILMFPKSIYKYFHRKNYAKVN